VALSKFGLHPGINLNGVTADSQQRLDRYMLPDKSFGLVAIFLPRVIWIVPEVLAVQ
jgi:hypothetical protein